MGDMVAVNGTLNELAIVSMSIVNCSNECMVSGRGNIQN